MSADKHETLKALMAKHGIGTVEHEDGETRLHLTTGSDMPIPPPAASRKPKEVIAAPQAGLFRLHHPLAAAEKNDAPRRVVAGDIVAYLQIGALLRPVVAQKDGVIGPALVEDGALTGYRSPLFAYL